MSLFSHSTRASRFRPRLVGLGFGSFWALLAAFASPHAYRLPAIAGVLVLSALFLLRAWRATPDLPAEKPFFKSRAYLVSIICEALAYGLVSATFPRFGLLEYLYSAIGVIVGLHFLGLWRVSGTRRFVGIAAGMCFFSCLSVAIPFSWRMFGLRYVVLGAGNALVLWLGASGPEQTGSPTDQV